MTAPYTSGTITLTNGSNIITGTNTGWATSLVAGGSVYPEAANGNAMPIATVDSDTKITAATKWKGASGTYPYAIVRDTADGQQTVVNAQALATYIQRLNNQMLAGLAALAPTANTLPFFGDNAAPALADISPFGRSLIAALNSLAAYGVLGEVPNIQLPTRLRENMVMEVRGRIGTGGISANANDLILPGIYYAQVAGDATVANNFPVAGSGVLEVTYMLDPANANAPRVIQRWTLRNLTEPLEFVRSINSTSYGIWVRSLSGDASGVINDVGLPIRLRAYPPTSGRPANADDVTEFGIRQVTNATTNTPVATAGVVFNLPYDSGTGRQIFFPNNADTAYFRRKAGTQQGWKRFDGDLSGPGAAVDDKAFVGFNGTTGYLTKALNTLEALANLGPVFGGVAPEPHLAGVGMERFNFDTLTYPGVYTVSGSWENGPNGAAASGYVGILEVQARSYNNLYVQILRLNNGAVHKRYAGSGPAWNAWVQTEDASTAASRALLALTPAADRLPYFNGASSAALTVLTSFARSVLDDANGATMFATMGADQLLAENGWVKLPNGLIIQWGQGAAGTGTATIAFPMAFPNACYRVIVGTEMANTTAAELYTTHVSSKTLTNFVLNGRHVLNGGTVGAGGVPANFIAIGR